MAPSVGKNTWVLVCITFNHGRFKSPTGRVHRILTSILLSILSGEEIERGVCIVPEPKEANHRERVTSLKRRIPEHCNWKSTS